MRDLMHGFLDDERGGYFANQADRQAAFGQSTAVQDNAAASRQCRRPWLFAAGQPHRQSDYRARGQRTVSRAGRAFGASYPSMTSLLLAHARTHHALSSSLLQRSRD
jgi:hypothetical protein